MDCDILIVGAGIFGVSTAYHLSKSPSHSSKIILLDRAPAPSPHAASTDINKIVRADYSSPFYMNLAYEAIDAFSTWPEFQPDAHHDQDGKIYNQTGWAMMDEKGSDIARRVRENFKVCGREDLTYDLTEAEMRTKWGGLLSGMDVEGYDTAYGSPSAGWVDASRAVEVMVKEAVRNGVKYEVGEVDNLVLQDGQGVRGVKLQDGRSINARQVLLATGAWTSQLMTKLEDELEMKEEDRIESQLCAAAVCVAHLKLSPEQADLYRQLPILVFGSEGEILPPTPTANIFKFTDAGSLKNTIATPTGHKITCPPPPTVSQSTIPPKLKQEMNALISRRFPSLFSDHCGGEVDYWRLCWDSITPNQQQLITAHPDKDRLGNLYFAVGGSFHSWKFLPIIGKYVVNVLDGAGNGEEKDRVWGWKGGGAGSGGRGAHEKVVPRRELRDME